jgi:hypothetical protein
MCHVSVLLIPIFYLDSDADDDACMVHVRRCTFFSSLLTIPLCTTACLLVNENTAV